MYTVCGWLANTKYKTSLLESIGIFLAVKLCRYKVYHSRLAALLNRWEEEADKGMNGSWREVMGMEMLITGWLAHQVTVRESSG